MDGPRRIQRIRAKGWRMPAGAVYAYREWLRGNPLYSGYERLRDHVLTHVDELRGRDLVCWCSCGQPCHADILLSLANE